MSRHNIDAQRKIKRSQLPVYGRFFMNGALGGDRTHNLQLRRLTLYPVELRARQHTYDNIICKGRKNE